MMSDIEKLTISYKLAIADMTGEYVGSPEYSEYRDRVSHAKQNIIDYVFQLQTENERLRGLLANVYTGHLLYSDDGELQDNSVLPCIDFKRDSAELIMSKMEDRAMKALQDNKDDQ
jgi:hypothetical protein